MKRNEEAEQAEEQEYTVEEAKNQMLANEKELIAGILEAANYKEDVIKKINIVRNGEMKFSFFVRAVSEEESALCKKKSTKYIRNKQLGMKFPEDTNTSQYNSHLIYTATVEGADGKKVWDNKELWSALNVLNGVDLVDKVLMAGEKERVIGEIEELSGFESQVEEVVKN